MTASLDVGDKDPRLCLSLIGKKTRHGCRGWTRLPPEPAVGTTDEGAKDSARPLGRACEPVSAGACCSLTHTARALVCGPCSELEGCPPSREPKRARRKKLRYALSVTDARCHAVSRVHSMADSSPAPSAARGAFIVLEGMDRAGKTTQASLLRAKLAAQSSRPVELIKFPGAPPRPFNASKRARLTRLSRA